MEGVRRRRYRDYPVTVVSRSESGGVIQIRWSATPHAGAFLEAMRAHTTILETVKVSEDFGNVRRLPREEQEKKIRELDAKGQTIEAIYLTRQVYGRGLAEAKENGGGVEEVSFKGAGRKDAEGA